MILMLASALLAPALQAVGWALLHLVWQGAAIAAALGLLLSVLPSRRANARYALSCAALALVVVAGVLTGVREYRARLSSTSVASATPARAFHAAPVLPAPGTPSVAAMVLTTYVPAPPQMLRVPLRDPLRAASDALPWVVSLWLAGVIVLSLRLIVQWLRARRLVTANAQPACEPWLAMANRLGVALGVRHVVRLLESTAVQVPAVVGLLKPVILLPANALGGLTPGQLEMILAHELAHIRRHDFLVNLLQAAVETLLFYHPAVWWISKQVRIERENCCDDLAVAVCGSPLQYARALTRLEELRAESLMFALSVRGGSLLQRIRRVVGGQATDAGPVRGVTALALLVGLALAFAGPSLTALARPQAGNPARSRQAAGAAAMAEPAAKPSSKACPEAAATMNADDDGKCPDAIDDGDPDEDSASAAADAAADDDADAAADDAKASVADGDAGDGADAGAYAPNSTEAIAHGHIRLTVNELIELRSQGVSTADILEMRSVFPSIEVRDIAGMYAVGATPEYVREMNAAGLVARTPEEAKNLVAVGVTPEFIAEMRSAGIPVKNARVACGLAAVGVTADYIRDMRAAGFPIASADEVKGLAAVGVTPEYIQGMRAAGLRVASANEAQGLAAVGVTPEFVHDLRASGLVLTCAEEAKGLAAVGVTPDYVRELRSAGVPIRDASDAKSLASIGVTAPFVRRLARAGYTNLSVPDLCRLGAGGFNEHFIEEMARYRTR
jgi:beta-lactamase regulating signal transducer with metallopeptidase domain